MIKKLLIPLCLVLLAGIASAVSSSWTNSAGGDYTNAANWSAGVALSPTQATFNIVVARNYTVDVTSASITNGVFAFQPSSTTNTTMWLNLHGNTFNQNDYFEPDGGSTGTNTLWLYNGTFTITANGILSGSNTGTTFNVNLTNCAVPITSGGYFYFGYTDSGGFNNLNIYDNSSMSTTLNPYFGQATPSQASLTINGANAVFTTVGNINFNGYAGNTTTLNIIKGYLGDGTLNLGTGGSNSRAVGNMTGGTNISSGALLLAGGNSHTNTFGELYLSGPNSPTCSCTLVQMNPGISTNSWAKLVVSNGILNASGNLTMNNSYQYGSCGQIIVNGSNSIAIFGGNNVVGTGYSPSCTSIVSVANGGTLEINSMTVGTNIAGNLTYLANNGGTYRFSTASLSWATTKANTVITNGTIAFRNCGSVDVLCNQSGKPLDSAIKLGFAGTNYFTMNAATNLATNQAYTFSPAYGATNWAGLTLTNGALWQGGDVTIGSNGMLSGSGTIANNLTLQSGATWYGNADGTYLTVSSNITLAGTLSMPAGFTVPAAGYAILAQCGGTVSGTLSGIPPGVTLYATNGYVALLSSAAVSAGFIQQITFSGYTRSETLTNFPVLIAFAKQPGFLSSNGYDLRFWSNATQTGSPLNYEIESWTNSGTCYVWVQVPTLTSNLSIWATWGNAAYTSQAAYTTNGATWNSYVGVWHMSEASSSNRLDSSQYRNNGVLTGGSVPATNGIVGGGAYFSGGYLVCGTGASLNLERTNHMSFSAWAYTPTTALGGSDITIFSKLNTANNYQGYEFLYVSVANNTWYASQFLINSWSGNNAERAWETTDLAPNPKWHYVSGSYNGNSAASGWTIAVDGVSQPVTFDRNSLSATIQNATALWIGSRIDGTWKWAGALDEVRIRTVDNSTNWIWAEYMNMASNTVFNLYGPVTTPSTGTAVNWGSYEDSMY